jgi:Fe-S cluster assembly iron-binding protein IscA
MLTITPTAAEALDAVVASVPDAPQSAGLRIAPSSADNGQPRFSLHLATEPEPGDQIVEGAEHPVFVDAAVAEELDDKVLDAQIEGDQVGFTLASA